MDLSSLSSSSLRDLVSLVEKREALADELAKLDGTILAALGGEATKERATKPGKRGPKKGPKPTMNKRGALKDFIVAELQAAGEKGVAVKELAERLGVKPGNIHVWFASTGKSVGAKRIAPGRYAL